MPSLLYELENNEALLLMYICGELPEEDRAEVEQMLASDGGLRMELEEMRSTLAESMESISALDRFEPITASAETITRRNVTKAMNQWKVDRLLARPIETPRRAWRYPMWVYPTSAVASILVGVLVWWGLSSPLNSDSSLGTAVSPIYSNSNSQVANSQVAVAENPPASHLDANDSGKDNNSEDNSTLLENSFTSEPAGLADAEAQASSLVSRGNDPAASIFSNEASQ
jgi:hypothetical protein